MRRLRITAGLMIFLSMAILVFARAWFASLPGGAPRGPLFIGFCPAALALVVTAVLMFIFSSAIERAWEERAKQPAPEIAAAAPPKPSVPEKEPGSEALLLLSMLQEKGRFVDFLMEDIGGFANEQVGAAA